MAWMTQLYKTYENISKNPNLLISCKMPLIPPSHTLGRAHVEIILDEESNIINVTAIPPENALTITPCTENSAGRSSGIAPNLLYDNLKYLAGDAYYYSGEEKYKKYHEAYTEQISKWCEDSSCPDDVKIICRYIKKGHLMKDLIDEGIFITENGNITKKWGGNPDNKPSDPVSTFVRFVINNNDGTRIDCNSNNKLISSVIEYEEKNYENIKLCYVTGKKMPVTYKHSSKIRHSGDSAKLISSNDSSGFTYRGRFRDAEEAYAVGYDVSQKAHSALRWLISNQGFSNGDQTVIAWAVNNDKIPTVFGDSDDVFSDKNDIKNKYLPMEEYSKQVELALNGYKNTLDDNNPQNIVVMIVEAATPGRLSITYYREFSEIDYIDNIKYWHHTCVWNHSYKASKKETNEDGIVKEISEHIKFTGAPAIKDIIFAAYGKNVDDKLKKHLYEVLISCVADRKKLPKDIMIKAVERTSNPQKMEEWELKKTTSVTCALIRKYELERGEKYDMAVDYNNEVRDYLFGRALAYAEQIESYILYKNGDKRTPNARKLRSRFQKKPASTWAILDGKLEPYVQKAGGIDSKWYYELQGVLEQLKSEEYFNDKPLQPVYLIGYAAQITEFQDNIKKEKQEDVKKEENNNGNIK